MVSTLSSDLARAFEAGLVLVQVGACIGMWLMLRRQERTRREDEIRLQLLIKSLRAERRATRARRMLAEAARQERPGRSLH